MKPGVDVCVAIEELLSRQVVLQEGMPGKRQIAALYYSTKAVRTARACQRLVEAGDLYEGWLLLRALYNLTVDALWVLRTENGAERFYDATAVGLERHARRYQTRGVDLGAEVRQKVTLNRRHFDRVKESFVTAKGKISADWAPGSIRDRADFVGKEDSQLRPLAEMYDDVYGRISDFEHSHPMLFTLYVRVDGGNVSAKTKPVPDQKSADWLAQSLAWLIWLVFNDAGKILGIRPEEISAI